MPMYTPIQDQSKWNGVVGIIPGELVQFHLGNNGTYKPAINRTLYVTFLSCNLYLSSTGEAYWKLQDSSGNDIGTICYVYKGSTGYNTTGQAVNFNPPLICAYPNYVAFYGSNSDNLLQGYII